MNRIAAALITGDAYHEDEVKALFESLEPHVHGIYVAFNGTGNLEHWREWTSLPLTISWFKWEDDFSKARDQSFSLVPKDEYDWIMWADTDDIFRVNYKDSDGEPLEEMFDSLDAYTKGIFVKYNYAIEPDTGIVVVEQWRERFFSTSTDWKWQWPVHEVCRAVGGAVQFARREHCWIDHQRKSGEDRGARERNRRILTKAAKEDPKEDRHVFYLAGETMAEADAETDLKRRTALADSAIETFDIFRQMRNNLDEDTYLATCRIAELNRMKGDHAAALAADMEAVAIFPNWPDGFVGAAKTCLELGDWSRMKSFAELATKIPKPATAVSIEPLNSSFTPIFLRGLANEELGELDQALRDYKEAIKHWRPPNGSLEERIKELQYKKKNSKKATEDERKLYRGTKPEKSICFYTNPLVEPWHPELLKKHGMGGAETCIMELAPYFAADGWRTVVFGTPGEYRGVHEGVEYWESHEWLAEEPFNIFVSSRSPLPWDSNINAKLKMLWMHDVNLAEYFIPYANLPDVVIGLSQWHVKHLQSLYKINKKKMRVIPNGINLDRFNVIRNDPSNAPKFIWLSSPDRGLDVLLSLWPLIREAYPEATLDMFYGWDMIDSIINSYKQAGHSHMWLEDFKRKVEHQMEYLGRTTAGLNWRGRVPPEELAAALYETNFWAYPTSFMETFCISAVQAQLAGVIPITSDLAALSENIAMKQNLIRGWPMNIDYQRRFLQTVDNMLTDEMFADEIRVHARQEGRKFAEQFSWNNVYDRWCELLQELGTIRHESYISLGV